MNTKSLILSATLMLAISFCASAQSLSDLQSLFGRQQPREQENAVKVDYNVDFHYFFDMRSFDVSNDIFMETNTLHLARFSPSAVVRFNQGRGITHRLALGIDLSKDLGVNPVKNSDIPLEQDPSIANTGLMKDIFFYYNYIHRTEKGRLEFYAGIHPRTVLEGYYTRAIFADDIIYNDPNIEGITLKYSSPRFNAEFGADMMGKKGIERIGAGMAFSSGEFIASKWFGLGWSGAFTHASGSILRNCDVNLGTFNPYLKFDFASLTRMQELYLKTGAIVSYQQDRKVIIENEETGEDAVDKPHYPLGLEAVLGIRNWNIGLENTFYFGDNQMEYKNSKYASLTFADVYAPYVYQGEALYFTRRNVPVWYNRLEAYWEPLETDFLKCRLSAVGHFVTPAGEIGPYIGMQAKAALIFNLDAFRHPRESVSSGRSGQRSNGNRDRRRSGGPLFSL